MHRLPTALLLALALLPHLGLTIAAEEPNPEEAILKAAGIATETKDLLDFFRRRTLPAAGQDRLETLVQKLGDDTFVIREAASSELIGIGSPAVPYLDRALKSEDLEVARRAEDCLRQISTTSSGPGVLNAAVRLLAARRPGGTVEALLAYLPFVESDGLADEIRAALAVLAVQDGKPEPALVAALTDPVPTRRAAAAAALCRAGDHEPAAVRKLLHDPEPTVRLHAALALAAVKEKEAIPVLIDLLAQLPPGPAWLTEAALLHLADGTGPTVALGPGDAGRRCRDAWAAWWRAHAAGADLTRLAAAPSFLGYTLVVLLNQGRILELGPDGKPRLQIDGLAFPLDAQWLPGDRILTAEYGSNRVTERDCRGEIRWQKLVESPLVAQRLPNGHTFIASRVLLLELDRDGKEVFSLPAPNGQPIMKALKLPNGDIACVTVGQRFYRLDTAGKELSSFTVSLQTSGGRVEVLPNGHVLIPQMDAGKVVEYDADGKAVWEAETVQPVAAVRLANGNTLVTSMSQRRAVELDRTGKEVWEYRADTMVNRAWRR
jgi:HEAT repeat protein